MAAYGRPTLRDLFDGAPTPHIAHPPETHHRDFYVATDGSFRESGGGLGVLIETRDGERVARLAVASESPDNNVAEYRALSLGLSVLATRSSPDVRVGLLLDHDQLAANVNASVLAAREAPLGAHHQISAHSDRHWQRIRDQLYEFTEVRAARIDSGRNPAHPLANTPEEYDHLDNDHDQCPPLQRPTDGDPIPPPSRADRGASD